MGIMYAVMHGLNIHLRQGSKQAGRKWPQHNKVAKHASSVCTSFVPCQAGAESTEATTLACSVDQDMPLLGRAEFVTRLLAERPDTHRKQERSRS